jgi:hypothetical protein
MLVKDIKTVILMKKGHLMKVRRKKNKKSKDFQKNFCFVDLFIRNLLILTILVFFIYMSLLTLFNDFRSSESSNHISDYKNFNQYQYPRHRNAYFTAVPGSSLIAKFLKLYDAFFNALRHSKGSKTFIMFQSMCRTP